MKNLAAIENIIFISQIEPIKIFILKVMTPILEEIIAFVLAQNSSIRFCFFFFSSFLESLFPPWPGDAITVFGGFLVSKGENLLLLGSSTFLGNLAGATFMYQIGNQFLLFLKKKNFYQEKRLEQIFTSFKKYSYLFLLGSRFMAGCRFLICPIAGVLKVNFGTFLVLFSLSVILWNFILIYSGYLLAENWSFFLKVLKTYTFSIACILIFFLVFFIISKQKIKFFKMR